MTRQRKHARPVANMLKALTVREASRYIELMEKAQGKALSFDLNDPCDRAILDVCISATEALELLSLHDRLNDAMLEYDDTKKVELPNAL